MFSLKFFTQKERGVGAIDVVIGIALFSIALLGIFGLFRLGFAVIGKSRAQLTGVTIASQRIEKIRSMPYDSVGVQGGFPDGILDPSTTTVQNDVFFTIEHRVDYVIDSADGIADPQDPCPNDYKKVEVRVSWTGKNSGEEVMTTNISPQNIAQECADVGGILSVSVFDAYGQMVPSPLIEIKDPDTDQVIKSATPDSGEYYFSLNSSTSYKVVVSKPGFSTDRTYGIDEVATPAKSHLWVFEDKLTPSSFSIDETSDFSVRTASPWGEDYFSDAFEDTSKISVSTDISIDNGEAEIAKIEGVYSKDGNTDSDLCMFPGNSGDCGQSFTMGAQAKSVSQIELLLMKATSSPSDIYLEVRTTSTTGPLVGTSEVKTGSSLPINLGWIPFDFTVPLNLSAGTQYFLRLRSVPDSVTSQGNGPIYWGHLSSTSSPPGYSGGKAFRYVGKNQEELANYDFSFNIYDDQYGPSGELTSVEINPASLSEWQEFSWTDSEPSNTDLRYQLFYASGTDWLLIPDSELSGNSTGFDLSPVDLSTLSTATFSRLKAKAVFSSSDANNSPSLNDWQVSWITSASTPIPNVIFNIRGSKEIGTDGDEDPVYKYSTSTSSGGAGHVTLPGLEWDEYFFSIPTSSDLDLMGTSPDPQPISLLPDNAVQEVILYLESNNSLLVTIKNNDTLEPVFSADVRLTNSGLSYDQTQKTNESGQTFFMPLEVATYDLEISASGYQSTSTSVYVSGDISKTLRLDQID